MQNVRDRRWKPNQVAQRFRIYPGSWWLSVDGRFRVTLEPIQVHRSGDSRWYTKGEGDAVTLSALVEPDGREFELLTGGTRDLGALRCMVKICLTQDLGGPFAVGEVYPATSPCPTIIALTDVQFRHVDLNCR